MMTPRPRSFIEARYKIRTTGTGSLPTDDDVVRSVAHGLPGTAMPGWADLLRPADILAVVDHLKSLSPRFLREQARPVSAENEFPEQSPSSVARGRAAYERLQCGKCHGIDGRGTGAVATEFVDDWGLPTAATDLTESWTFRGGATPRDVFFRLRTGMAGTPMPSFADASSDPELRDLGAYVVSLARTPVWDMRADELQAFYADRDREARANPVKRGRYLVGTLGCATCHSPLDEERRVLPGMKFAGGLLFVFDPFGRYPTGNLTSDRETGLGSWSDDEIIRAFTLGVLRDGTRLPPAPMDYASYGSLTAADQAAIVAYLRTIPPVRNKVPPPTKTALLRHIWLKFSMFFLGLDPPIVLFAGNVGDTGDQSQEGRR